MRPQNSEQIMPLFEATRKSRNTLLLGDLGTGKSTTVAQLVIDTLDKSPNTIAILVPVKNLKLDGRFSVRELVQIVNDFLINDVVKSTENIDLKVFLDKHTEVLVVFDGLDELSYEMAARLLRNAASLSENWPTIQTVATARPIELKGAAFANWKVIYTAPLTIERKQEFILKELIADGLEQDKALLESEILIRKLKEQPELDSLASTPLTIRLLYPHLKNSTPEKSSTLGDLLYELLLMLLDDWQKRDDKPSNFDHFEFTLPTAEAKMEFLSALTIKAMENPGVSVDEAKAIFLDKAESYNEKNAHLLAKEALSYFEWLGLITISDAIDFPLQSLAEMSAAAGLLKVWKSGLEKELPSGSLWRVVSFLSTIARRRGQLEAASENLHRYIQQLLEPDSLNLPAACYIVAESNDKRCAELAIKSFYNLERRPLSLFGDDQTISARNIAKTIWLAEEDGFNWLYTHYLDPKYPIINAGSRVIQVVFTQWAAIAYLHLGSTHKELLTKMVPPYLATESASFFGVLDMLAVLVPDAFKLSDRLWYQAHSLDSPLFGNWVSSQFINTPMRDKPLLEKVLLTKLKDSKKAAAIWLELNPDSEPPISLIKHALRLIRLSDTDTYHMITEECIARLGREKWMHFARWFIFDSDRGVATGAVIVLYRDGEKRLSILGETLVDSLHDGGYQADAEVILLSLINESEDNGIRWLASKISNYSDEYGAHSGLWRIFINQVRDADDGPELLAGCVHQLGRFVLPRYPEVREAFSQLLQVSDGKDYADSLRNQLHSLTPAVREGAAKILISTNPKAEGEALFVAIRSRANRSDHHTDADEWEKFCLSLNFSSGVLTLLQSRLHLLDPRSRTFALFLLVKNSVDIQDGELNELRSSLLALDNWHLAHDPVGKKILSTEESFTHLLSIIEEPTAREAQRAAGNLLELHSNQLESKDKAKCTALSIRYTGWPRDLTNIMVKITSDENFADVFTQASKEIKAKGGKKSLLENVLSASKGECPWKDVLWEMLCDDSSFGGSSQSETSGSALLEYGFTMDKYSRAIGDAAVECLSDPRVESNRWTDAYHWLAVIADEFTGLSSNQIQSILEKSNSAIRAESTASLLARLGHVPEGIQFRRSYRNEPNFSADETIQNNEASSIISRLNDFSRDSEALHAELIPTIERSLYLDPFDGQVVTNFSARGKPGMLVATTLRHCYGHPPQLFETIPLLNHWGVNNVNDHAKKKLQNIWRIIRYSVHESDEQILNGYLEILDENVFSSNAWELFVAFELFRVRGSLLEAQIESVFIKYIDRTSYLHERIFEELVKWLSGELDEATKRALIRSTHTVLIILNENTSYSSYEKNSLKWVFCIFPVMQWVLEEKQTPEAESVFLRSLQCALEASSINALITKIEPLLNMIPPHIIKETIASGKESPEPTMRAFCQLVDKLSQFNL